MTEQLYRVAWKYKDGHIEGKVHYGNPLPYGHVKDAVDSGNELHPLLYHWVVKAEDVKEEGE